jgi:hypothetical protein
MTCQLRLTKRLFLIAVSAAIISSVLPPNSAAAITLGQADNFQDGGLHGWVGGGAGGVASAQMNIPGGGPSGAEDNYLQLSAGGTGGAPRLLGYNQSQWTGDFLAAGVSGVAMDLLNSGASALSIRIAVREGTGNSGTPGYASTNAFNLPPDNAWHHALFLLDAADLTGVNSPQALTIDLANVKEFRILDSASVSLMPLVVSATLASSVSTTPRLDLSLARLALMVANEGLSVSRLAATWANAVCSGTSGL